MSDGSPAASARGSLSLSPRIGRRNSPVNLVLNALASLRITVTLLSFSLFLVLAGTLAQVNHDIWHVVSEYFRTWVARVTFNDLVPNSWFPGSKWATLPGGFYFPGGWTLGLALGINQIASMLTKFTIKARGTKLWAGLAVTAAGVAMTWAVVMSGMGGETGQGEPLVGYEALWRMIQVCITALGVGMSVWTLRVLSDPAKRKQPATALIASGAALGLGLAVWSLFVGTVSDSSGRILWQLIKASFAAAVLLGGLMPLFGRQGGTFLLHCGLLMLLASEFHTGVFAREGVISLQEGEAKNYISDTRSFEFALVAVAEDGAETHHVIDGRAVSAAAATGSAIDDPRLPVIVEPLAIFPNSTALDLKDANDVSRPVPEGALEKSRKFVLVPLPQSSGVEADAAVDLPAGEFRLLKRTADGQPGESLGTVSAWALLPDNFIDDFEVDGTTYRAELRFAREYLPFRVGLTDVRADFYPGTSQPSHYSSDLRFDPVAGPTDLDATPQPTEESAGAFDAYIWMNNPLRYAGRTFYQQGYDDGIDDETGRRTGPESTVLQVVTNTGWMVPYVSCMILAFGMLAQFGMSLLRFLARRGPVPDAEQAGVGHAGSPSPVGGAPAAADEADPAILRREDEPELASLGWIVPLATVLLFGGYAVSKWRAPKPYEPPGVTQGFDLAAFEKVPVLQGGRYKPIGTVARNALKAINGNKQEFLEEIGKGEQRKEYKRPAAVWLLDVMADVEAADDRRIYRIANEQVRKTLGLEARDGLTYAYSEFAGDADSEDRKERKKAERFAKARERARRAAGEIEEKPEADQADPQAAEDGENGDEESAPAKSNAKPSSAEDRAFIELFRKLNVRQAMLLALNPDEFAPAVAGGSAPLPVYEQLHRSSLQSGRAPLTVPRPDGWDTL
ncbi:MAG: cytochrome c biogenesis protein ResB, partial [Planctomycetota bacterium]